MSVNLVKLCDGIRALADWERELRETGEGDRADKVRGQIAEMVELASKMPAETRAGFRAKTRCLAAIVEVYKDLYEQVSVRALWKSIENDKARFGGERNAGLD